MVGLNVRTLQRRLESQAVTYKQLIDRARFDLASQLLRQSHATVTDIAFDVGYTDVAHFTRAFRRWTGVSPREYRRYHARAFLFLASLSPVSFEIVGALFFI